MAGKVFEPIRGDAEDVRQYVSPRFWDPPTGLHSHNTQDSNLSSSYSLPHTRILAKVYEGWNFNSSNTAVGTPCNGTK
jgi:hypothetical protein